MSEKDNGGFAFPHTVEIAGPAIDPFDGDKIPAGQTRIHTFHGMELRDWFAAKAMPACYAETCRDCGVNGWPEDWKMGVALDAYAMADAMLKAREL